jgi:hypothetical protein
VVAALGTRVLFQSVSMGRRILRHLQRRLQPRYGTLVIFGSCSHPIVRQAAPVKSAVVQEDEAAAMAAIFSAQSQNWEETQEKMSQLVYPPWIVDHFLMDLFPSTLV